MSAPDIIGGGCAEIRAKLREMAEEGKRLRTDIAAATRDGYERGYLAGYADAVTDMEDRARRRGVEL